jgi:hypothetical protein
VEVGTEGVFFHLCTSRLSSSTSVAIDPQSTQTSPRRVGRW